MIHILYNLRLVMFLDITYNYLCNAKHPCIDIFAHPDSLKFLHGKRMYAGRFERLS